MLNDPARGIDVGAKLDLYRNLRDFAAKGKAVVFLSSEIEEFLNLCTRVLVFRNGVIASAVRSALRWPCYFECDVRTTPDCVVAW